MLPTAITTDDEKINFTYTVADGTDIHESVEVFTDVTMELVEGARKETKKQQKPNHQSVPLPNVQLLKIHSQILTIRNDGKYNMLDTLAVQREAHELGFFELVIFIEDHKADYAHFILTVNLPDLPQTLYPIPGSAVMLDEMPHDPNPVPPGTVGTVEGYDDECEILMNWQNGRNLKLIPDVDTYHEVETEVCEKNKE